MRFSYLFCAILCVTLVSCDTFLKPSGWPVETAVKKSACDHMIKHVKFSGSMESLTHEERALLTFLHNPDNIAAAVGRKNRPGSHEWSAAEVYLVDPGKYVSVLCENGYQQKAVYFHYHAEKKTWYRVSNLEDKHRRGVPAVLVKE